jgi:hypothetical protein
MLYCAIIGDIIDSRNMAGRSVIQSKLSSVLTKANDRYKEHIASLFTVTLGDEFQGLLSGAAAAFDAAEYIQRKMHPVRFRFGIGLGEIITGIDRDISIGADGPAFYRARDMIKKIKSKENSLLSYQPEILFQSQGCDDGLINAVAVMYRQLERDWTDKQRRYIDCFMDGTENQYAIAKHFNVKQPSVNRAFERAGLYKYLFALEQLRNYFKNNNY